MTKANQCSVRHEVTAVYTVSGIHQAISTVDDPLDIMIIVIILILNDIAGLRFCALPLGNPLDS
jgi:hypothetical protein